MHLHRLALPWILVLVMGVCSFTLASAAYGEVLCVPKTAKVSRSGQLALGSRILVRDVCKKGEVPVLDTSLMKGAPGVVGPAGAVGPQGPKGEKGASGMPALSYSTCYKKSDSSFHQNGVGRLSVPGFELQCAGGEYAYLRRETIATSCSSDFSWRWDDGSENTDCDGPLYVPVSSRTENQAISGAILDDSETFVTGHSHSLKAGDKGIVVLSGTISSTRTIILTCCILGD